MSNLTKIDHELLERVVVGGDLAQLAPEQRLEWYRQRCEAADVDPRTQPFQYLQLSGKLVLYATKACSDQLIARRNLTVEIIDRRTEGDLYEVTCRAIRPDGSKVDDVGVVSVGGLKGDAAANARMKAITKAKRRTVLSACGLGMLDESELETIRDARPVRMEEVHAPALPPKRPFKERIAAAQDLEELQEISAELMAELAKIPDLEQAAKQRKGAQRLIDARATALAQGGAA